MLLYMEEADVLFPSGIHQHELFRREIQGKHRCLNAAPLLFRKFPTNATRVCTGTAHHDEVREGIFYDIRDFHAEDIFFRTLSALAVHKKMRAQADISRLIADRPRHMQRQLPVCSLDYAISRLLGCRNVLAARQKRRCQSVGMLKELIARADRLHLAAVNDSRRSARR